MAPRFFSVVALLVALVLPFHGLSAPSALCLDSENAGGQASLVTGMAGCDQDEDTAPMTEQDNSSPSHCQASTDCCAPAIAKAELVTAPHISVCAPSGSQVVLSDAFHPETLERPPLVS